MSDAAKRLEFYAMLGASLTGCTCGHVRAHHYDDGRCRAGFANPADACDCPAFMEAVS